MPGPRKDITPQNAFVKNLLTALLLMTSIVITVAGIYMVQSLFYGRPNHLSRPTGSMRKITGITRDDVFDLSGSEASGNGDPMKLFDENADPANGIMIHPHTQPLPNSKMAIFYPPGRGLRIVADLHGLYALSDFFIYDKALETDSVWLYTGEMNNWKLVAAYATSGHVAAWGWRNFTVNQLSRYVMIRFNSYKPVISELVLYGNLQE
ncbi:MAG: hypothetical protein ABJC98_21900, partial [Bacteroidota bacterium]